MLQWERKNSNSCLIVSCKCQAPLYHNKLKKFSSMQSKTQAKFNGTIEREDRDINQKKKPKSVKFYHTGCDTKLA